MGNRLAKDLVDVSQTTLKPIFVVWGSPVGDEVAYKEVLLKSSVPTFRTFSNAVLAARAFFDHREMVESYRSPFSSVPTRPSRGAATARRILAGSAPGAALSEHVSKQLLSAYGIPMAREELCASPAAALSAARSTGYPVVMKACSPALSHKSELGLVVTGVTSDRVVRSTWSRLMDLGAAELGGTAPDGILVAEQVHGGVEMALGIAQDELFGPVVMLGSGGMLVELLSDVVFRAPPFSKTEARRMISELKGSRLLRGYRGGTGADIGALVGCVMKIQRLALDLSGELLEVDVNPLYVMERGAVALDALVVGR
jgi:acyl-CoA synthetase (NDP forming)